MIIDKMLFNYDTTSKANVPINLRREYESIGCLDLPEYEHYKKKNNPICYACDNTNSSLIIKVRFQENSGSLDNKFVKIKATAVGENILGSINEENVGFIGHYSVGDYIDFKLNLNQIAKFKIGRFICEWKWEYCDPNTNIWIEIETIPHLVYVIPHKPLALWVLDSFNSNYLPWVNALDYICQGLNKTDSTKTDDEIRKMVALWVNSRVVEYDTVDGKCAYSSITRLGSILKPSFNPILFIKDFKRASETNKLKINCNDCATINSFFLSLLGIENEITYLSNDLVFSAGFECNKIKPIGHDNWVIPFGGGFKYHAVCSSNNGNNITDSCLQIDSGTDPWDTMPATGTIKIGKIACMTPFSKQLSSVPYFEDCYRERLCKQTSIASCNVVSSTKELLFSADIPKLRMKNTLLVNENLKLILKETEKKSVQFLFQAESIKFSHKFQSIQKTPEENKIYTFYDVFCNETKEKYLCEFYFCEDFEHALGCADSLIFESVVLYEKTKELDNYLDIGFVSVTNASIIGIKENLVFRFMCDKLENDTNIIKFSKLFLSDL